jgi:hydrogenase maturation protein HypF
MNEARRGIIRLGGVVQGVGFRPFVYRLAHAFGLPGMVYNDVHGVVIEVEGEESQVRAFCEALPAEAPPLARIIRSELSWAEPQGYLDFAIVASEAGERPSVLIAPDVGLCADCARELADPSDRRCGYPFINCTNCGPRFSIVRSLPYDRPRTTMARFPMCPECGREYEDPADRRFHAQPNACPACGPKAFLRTAEELAAARQASGRPLSEAVAEPRPEEAADQAEVFARARALLREGKILAVKGIGGFHLVCDAHQAAAVETLRRRKHREAKPFALMCPDLSAIRRYALVDETAEGLLRSWRRPIVLLPKRPDPQPPLAGLVAPGVDTLGVMLAYAPLHALLFAEDLDCLVATSGNLSDSPLVLGNEEAAQELSGIADAFLLHNRDIHNRCDDSVVTTVAEGPLLMRRSRGYAPEPLEYGRELRSLLAVGGDQKNTFCLTSGRRFYLSQHIGEVGDLRSLAFLEEALGRLSGYFEIAPEAVVYDLHPEYRSTKLAHGWYAGKLPLVGVQHHEAHLASCLAEHGVEGPVLGVVCDGTGYGRDGKLWGFEFFAGAPPAFQRRGHLAYAALPGGEGAIHHPGRMAFSYLWSAGGEEAVVAAERAGVAPWTAEEGQVLRRQLALGLNSPSCSSAGRLFDAVSALAGVCREGHYEGQPAIELEARLHVDPPEVEVFDRYPFGLWDEGEGWVLDPTPMWLYLVDEVASGTPPGVIAARFHHTVRAMIVAGVDRLHQETGVARVALSGGVFQNRYLVETLHEALTGQGYEVLLHRQVPPNDGGLSLGQALLGDLLLRQGG